MKASIKAYKPYILESWNLFKKEWGFFIIAILILLLTEIVDSLFGIDSPTNSFLITLIALIASLSLTVGFMQATFDYIDTRKMRFETYFGAYKNLRKIVNYTIGYMLFSLATYGSALILGAILGGVLYLSQPNIFTDISLSIASGGDDLLEAARPILPQLSVIMALVLGVILYTSTRLGFIPFLVVDKNLKPVEAFKKSLHMTKGHVWYILSFSLFLVGFNILGLFSLVIGLVFTIPISIIAYFLFYRSIVQKHAF